MVECEIGKQFSSYSELTKFIKEYEDANFIQFFKSSSRTIQGARKKGMKRFVKNDLVYAEITYSCIHSGKRTSRSNGQRPNQGSYRQNCPAHIKFKISTDGNALEVRRIVDNHNHEVNKMTYACLPRQRAVHNPARKMMSMSMQVCRKSDLMDISDSPITLQDFHNLKKTGDVLLSTIEILKEQPDSIVEILNSPDDLDYLGIFYQDHDMRKKFEVYPEILFVDSVHNANDERMPLYVMMVEDGNGNAEIVGFFLLTEETVETMKKMAVLFKLHNSNWEKTRVIYTDKDFIERQAFQAEFPVTKHAMCVFQILRTFRREVTIEGLGIKYGERDDVLELLGKMANSVDEEEYSELFIKLQKSKIQNAITYVEDNWHPFRHQWVGGMQLEEGRNFGCRKENRLESANQKISHVVQRHSAIDEMFIGLLELVNTLRIEWDCQARKTQLKVPLNVDVSCDAEKEYLKILTPYAFQMVSEKIRLRDAVKIRVVTADGIVIHTEGGVLVVSPIKCSCTFFVGNGLPCQHIFKCREVKEEELFCEDLVNKRWTRTYFLENSRMVDSPSTNEIVPANLLDSNRVLSHTEKYRFATSLSHKIASLACGASKTFSLRMKNLTELVSLWENDKEAVVNEIPSDEDTTPCLTHQPHVIHASLAEIEYPETS